MLIGQESGFFDKKVLEGGKRRMKGPEGIPHALGSAPIEWPTTQITNVAVK